MPKRVGGFINQDGLNAPDQATGVSAASGNESASVSFTAPADVGGSAITGFRAQSNDGIGASASASPITVTGLTNDTAYTFRVWALNAFGLSSPSDASGSVTPALPQIGLFAEGFPNQITEITITTTGNASDFGDLSVNRTPDANASSSTRCVFAGGSSGNVIDYVTFTSAGNAIDFGDLSITLVGSSGTSNGTRGVIGGGNVSGNISNVMQYLTIATTGNTSDYGDLSVSRSDLAANVNSTTRGVYSGGQGQDGDPVYNTMDYITIASTGNATDFGDLLAVTRNHGGLSNSTRGLFFAGNTTDASTRFNTIQYITIASTGNTADFGDLSSARTGVNGVAGLTRGVMAGGQNASFTEVNTIEYVTIATTGNASDFGDLVSGKSFNQNAGSSAHGGLS